MMTIIQNSHARNIAIKICLFIAFITLAGCASQTPKQLATQPRSILVLPPVNNSVEVNAPYIFLANISEPLAERGYYVFPVAVIDRFMKENGMHTPAQMHDIPPEKLREHIAADAVLYIKINDWGQKYQVIQSTAIVDASLTLVDGITGQQLWTRRVRETYSGSSGGNGLAGALIGAVIDQVAGSLMDQTPDLARRALHQDLNYLPAGPYRIEASQR